MIKIDPPSEWPIAPGLLRNARERMAEWYRQPDEVRRQQGRSGTRTNVDRIRRAVRPHLVQLFAGKCGYCEQRVENNFAGEIDSFRPNLDASDLDGKGSIDHYGWLAIEPANMILACSACSRAKRNLFPVSSQRAPILTSLDQIDRFEQTMLLNPYDDDPREHLEFRPEGIVLGLSSRGETTIEVLALNRERLARERARVWAEASAYLGQLIIRNQLGGPEALLSSTQAIRTSR